MIAYGVVCDDEGSSYEVENIQIVSIVEEGNEGALPSRLASLFRLVKVETPSQEDVEQICQEVLDSLLEKHLMAPEVSRALQTSQLPQKMTKLLSSELYQCNILRKTRFAVQSSRLTVLW